MRWMKNMTLDLRLALFSAFIAGFATMFCVILFGSFLGDLTRGGPIVLAAALALTVAAALILGGRQGLKAWSIAIQSCMAASLLACRHPAYDFTPLEQAIDAAIPLGSSPERAVVVLDSLAIPHGEFDPVRRTLIGSQREPSPGTVFGTLRVVLTYDGNRHLVDRDSQVVFTGP